MLCIFINTDVIIDFLADRKPFSKEASILFSLMEQKKINGYISSLCFSNLYFILRKAGSHEKVIKSLKSLSEFLGIMKVDAEIIKLALSSDFKDFEDSIQYYTAEASRNIDFIITRNTKDFKNTKIIVMTPETFLTTMQNQSST